ncbi:unnamed protein product [Ixodes pacificus]
MPRHTLSLIYPTESVCARSMLSLNRDEHPVPLWLTLVRPSSSFCTHSNALFFLRQNSFSALCTKSSINFYIQHTLEIQKTSCWALLSFRANHKSNSHVSRTPVTTELT